MLYVTVFTQRISILFNTFYMWIFCLFVDKIINKELFLLRQGVVMVTGERGKKLKQDHQ
jgi:hypothetical protein